MENKFEYSAGTADEAIEKGLESLNLSREQVEIEILDTGAKGLFGLGSRPARVAISLKETAAAPEVIAEIVSASVELEEMSRSFEEELDDDSDFEKEEIVDSEDSSINEDALKVTVSVVQELIEKMRIKATVSGKIGTLETSGSQPMVLIDIKGDDLSYLIGRHSETLNAFQYITSLIVGRELGHWIPMVIDVQGYRERREKQLRQMANRLADQVIKSGRRISLEPMPGTERRIIHLILRDRTDIYTESVGEEPNRKVVIYPKN